MLLYVGLHMTTTICLSMCATLWGVSDVLRTSLPVYTVKVFLITQQHPRLYQVWTTYRLQWVILSCEWYLVCHRYIVEQYYIQCYCDGWHNGAVCHNGSGFHPAALKTTTGATIQVGGKGGAMSSTTRTTRSSYVLSVKQSRSASSQCVALQPPVGLQISYFRVGIGIERRKRGA